MKIPRRPPAPSIANHSQELLERAILVEGPLVRGKYPHYDKLLHYSPPAGMNHDEWWAALKFNRRAQYRKLPLKDPDGNPFQFLLFDSMLKILHEIDLTAGAEVQFSDSIANPNTRDRYYVNSLIEEAVTSSQLEGATTTRLIAKEMIRTGRRPRDKSEQMILNNFLTMRRIGEIKEETLTKELVLEIHRMVTEETLEDPTAAGRFRHAAENVVVADDYDTVFHNPPAAQELEGRMEAMCDFANATDEPVFIHPVIRSIILHFWLAYDHPFVDGNGRTARALFYWSMLHHGFWLFEFVSISRLLKNAPAQYGKAFLYTETDDNDLTYFLVHQLEIIQRSIEDLHTYLQKKTEETLEAEKRLRGMKRLNHRQQALIAHALRHPHSAYTIESHRMSHGIAYGTAHGDLAQLHAKGLLIKETIGKALHFRPAKDLAEKLAE